VFSEKSLIFFIQRMKWDQLPLDGDQKAESRLVVSVPTPDSPDPPTKFIDENDVPENSEPIRPPSPADQRLSGAESKNINSVVAAAGPSVGAVIVAGKDDKQGEKDTRQESGKTRTAPQSRHPDGGYGWVIVFACFLQQVRYCIFYMK
jgi:hypothetical protein